VKPPRNRWLIAGGCLSAAAALLHLAVIVGGPDWYRFFGAGEGFAVAAERGRWTPHLVAAGIAVLLSLWAAYAFSGAGLIRRLPLLRTALVTISAIYLARGLVILYPAGLARPDLSPRFMLWSSLIVLVYGIVHALGTWRAWPHLSRRKDVHALGS
jgi:hypothetical protein